MSDVSITVTRGRSGDRDPVVCEVVGVWSVVARHARCSEEGDAVVDVAENNLRRHRLAAYRERRGWRCAVRTLPVSDTVKNAVRRALRRLP